MHLRAPYKKYATVSLELTFISFLNVRYKGNAQVRDSTLMYD